MLYVFSTLCLCAQGGLNIYAGLAHASNQDEIVTPSGTSQKGYLIGADFRIAGEKMYFIIGSQYMDIDLISTNKSSYWDHTESIKLLKGRAGLGFSIFPIANLGSLRTKILGSLDYILDYNREAIVTRKTHRAINDAVLGLVTGIGVDIKAITFDIEYEFGMINLYNKESRSKQDFLTVQVGFFF